MTTVVTPKKASSIPGPLTLPLLGSRINMLRLFGEPFTYLRELHAKYGNIVALAKNDPAYVCAFGPELNLQLLSQPDLFEVSAGPFENTTKDTPLMRVGGNSLQVMKGDKHRQQRRLMQPAFHRQQVAQYRDDVVHYTHHMLDSWQGRTQIELFREMELLTRSIVVKSLFGLTDEDEIENLGSLLERMVSSIGLAVVLPLNIPGTPYHHMQRMAEQLEIALKKMITHKRTQADAHDLLATLIQTRDEDGTTLSDKELVSHAFTMFTAGHSTTSAALTWTLFLLDQHPQVSAKLLDELRHELQGEAPAIEQLKRLTYLDGVVKESLRLLPPGGIGMRKASAPCELGGYELPKGSIIIYSEFLTHRLPELYTEPDRFKPERWEGLKRTAYEYLPFSAGQHRCIGAEFAIQETKVALATIFQRYRLEIVPETRLTFGLDMRPKQGMPMHVLPQDKQFHQVPVRGGINQLIDLKQSLSC